MSPRAPELDNRFGTRDPPRRRQAIVMVVVVVVVVVLHALLAYALVSGLDRERLNPVNKPKQAVVIQEVIIPPPLPPSPRKVAQRPEAPKVDAPQPYVPAPVVVSPVTSNAPVIQAVSTPAPAPAVMAPTPPVPVATGPKRTGIGLACPHQVPPEMPRRALQEGTEGVVKAQIHIRHGRIVEVTILSGPPVFHAAVKAAIMQYTCVSDGDEVMATQEFNFKLE